MEQFYKVVRSVRDYDAAPGGTGPEDRASAPMKWEKVPKRA